MIREAEVPASVTTGCPVCTDRRLEPVLRRNGWTVYRCAACTNGFLGGVPAGETSRERPDWFQRRSETRGAFRRGWRALGKVWKGLIYGTEFEDQKLRRILRRRDGGRLLDIGCGKGEFLSVAQRYFDVQGVEVSPTGLERARATLGSRVFSGDLLEAKFPAASFDVITMFSTVEHLQDPVAVLRECRRLLRDGGILVIKTPNFSSLNRRLLGGGWSGYKLPEHRFFFTPRGIEFLFVRAGLDSLPTPWLDRLPLSDNMYAYAGKGEEREGIA